MTKVLQLLGALQLFASTFSMKCPSTYKQQNFVLRNKVFSSLNVKNQKQCTKKCTANTKCFSINYYEEKQKCELNSATHLSSPEDLVYSVEGTYIKLNDRSEDICSDKYCSDGQICVVKKTTHDYICRDCNAALGMESRQIPNSAITASSYRRRGYEGWRGRLNNQPAKPYNASVDSGVWRANNSDILGYLQIDLGTIVRVTMVATQGRPIEDMWVQKYNLAYALNKDTFVDYQVNGAVKQFQGNTDKDTVVTNKLPVMMTCRYIRFVPVSWRERMAMRVEVYGCPDN